VPTASILQYLRRVVGPVDGDALLLDRFVQQRDEAAFAEIIQRHGAMVWGVCSRALPRSHDAEDAYQAAFLVLARKASSISRPELLANWLFGVARRTSLEARKRRARIREREGGESIDVAAPEPASTDLQDALDEEIARLPDRFRVPIVLCCLEGRTNAEAARILSCPEGTVASRLSTARDRLHAGLTRRGLAPVLGGIAVAIAQTRLEAMPPVAATASSTILADGVIHAMFLAKLKVLVLGVFSLALLGAAGIAGIAWIQVSAQPIAADPIPDAKSGNLLTKLRDVARDEFELRRKAFVENRRIESTGMPAGGGSGSLPVVLDHKVKDLVATVERGKLLDASQRLLRAEILLAADGPGGRQAVHAALVAQVDRLKGIEKIIRERVAADTLPPVAQMEIESIRLDAEVRAQRE
jgi:RNA polymerase sigma factor (sigma-70 family)